MSRPRRKIGLTPTYETTLDRYKCSNKKGLKEKFIMPLKCDHCGRYIRSDIGRAIMKKFEMLLIQAQEIHDRAKSRESASGDTVALRSLGEQRVLLDTMCKISDLLVEAMVKEQKTAKLQLIDLDFSDFTKEELKFLANLGIKLRGKWAKIP